MPVDETSLLPDPPPPRPARRDAAIAAAMRRFDGREEPQEESAGYPARRTQRWGFGGRPQFGALVTASLVVVIGLPAALIAIRDSQPSPRPATEVPAPARPNSTAQEMAEVVDRSPEAVADAVQAIPAPPTVKPPEPNRRMTPADQSDDSLATASAIGAVAPPLAIAAAPPPPPPPSPPSPPAAERDEAFAENSQIVVTGGRIPSPSLVSENIRDGRGRSQAVIQKSNVPATAPKWVLDNGAYRRFLGQLQAAVRSNNRSSVVNLVRLPLRVNFDGGSRTYRDARSVLGDFDRIFTPQVRQAILGQRFENLFGRDQGVMIGDGEVWFDHVCRNPSCSPPGPVRISAINP